MALLELRGKRRNLAGTTQTKGLLRQVQESEAVESPRGEKAFQTRKQRRKMHIVYSET